MALMQIRQNVFETNSSSTHSITMVDGATYADWKEGNVLFNEDKGEFKAISELPEGYDEDEWVTYDAYWAIEAFEDSYTTKSGETVIAFGMYGSNY